MARRFARAHELACKLADAGLIPGDINEIRRVVFVLDAREVPVMYVEYYADDRWLDVVITHERPVRVVTHGTVGTAAEAAT